MSSFGRRLKASVATLALVAMTPLRGVWKGTSVRAANFNRLTGYLPRKFVVLVAGIRGSDSCPVRVVLRRGKDNWTRLVSCDTGFCRIGFHLCTVVYVFQSQSEDTVAFPGRSTQAILTIGETLCSEADIATSCMSLEQTIAVVSIPYS